MTPVFILTALTFLCVSTAFGQPAPAGIGLALAIVHREEGKQLQIMGVAPRTPAARAGLSAGQVIRAIDGVPTAGLKIADCVARIRGATGTTLVLEVEDGLRGRTNSVELTREVIAAETLIPPPRPSPCPDEDEVPQALRVASVSVTTNQAVRVTGTNGAIAMIRFTELGATNAHYHWRFRPAGSGSVSSGAGGVFEDYETRIDAYGVHHLTERGGGDAMKVKAGDFRLAWSYGSFTNAWLYYYSSGQKVEVLGSDAFDSGP